MTDIRKPGTRTARMIIRADQDAFPYEIASGGDWMDPSVREEIRRAHNFFIACTILRKDGYRYCGPDPDGGYVFQD